MGNARNQEALVAALPADACLTVEELSARVSIERRAVVTTAARLIDRGLLERVERGCFRLTGEGVRAQAEGVDLNSGPRGRHTGRRTPRRTTLRTRLWRAMRTSGKFTVGDLLTAAARGHEKAAHSNAYRYLKRLEEAGYLRRLRARAPGVAVTSNGFVRWALLTDTGPDAPIPRRRDGRWEVFDPNTREVHPCAR